MKKSKTLASALILSLIVLAPACRTSRKKVEPAQQPVVEETKPPVVETRPVETEVKPQDDFVKPQAEPQEETLPADIEELNRYVQERGYIRDAYFNYDESTLDDAAQSALTASANWLKGREGAGYSLLVEGHCDERGTEQYNLALGDRRANVAKDYLVTLGVDAGRIRTVSYGEERPFDDGHDESAWRTNRRAHLVLVR